jgi:hypothetical protein
MAIEIVDLPIKNGDFPVMWLFIRGETFQLWGYMTMEPSFSSSQGASSSMTRQPFRSNDASA